MWLTIYFGDAPTKALAKVAYATLPGIRGIRSKCRFLPGREGNHNSVVKMRGNDDDAIPYDCEAKTLGIKWEILKGILREVRGCDGWCL
jgi:hypothetical protein